MKYINKLSLAIFFLITIAVSCKKDEKINYFEGGVAPVLLSSMATNSVLPLSDATKDDVLFTLSWTNPNYKFSTGVSSQNVIYALEIDSAGKNFSSSKKKVVTPDPAYTLSQSLKVGELNDYLLNVLKFNTTTVQTLEIRLKASLINNTGVLYSNAIQYKTTAYPLPPKIAVPASGRLFMIGDATPGGWPNPVPEPSQEFTRVDATTFELTLALNGGKSYLLLPVNGSWSAKYGGIGANNTNNVDADDFKPGGGDLKAPAASGNYKITVDFQAGRFTLTKL
jgi:hypothetical protein